jgi:hypothetical protein
MAQGLKELKSFQGIRKVDDVLDLREVVFILDECSIPI